MPRSSYFIVEICASVEAGRSPIRVPSLFVAAPGFGRAETGREMPKAEKHLSKQKATSGLSSMDNDYYLVTETRLVTHL